MRPSPWIAPLALVVFAACDARAEDSKVKEADVPKAVVEAVQKKYPGGTVTAWTKETDEKEKKDSYEAKVEIKVKAKDGSESVRKVEVTLSAEGKILAEEEKIASEALPDVVKKAIAASKWAKWTVRRVERQVLEEKDADARYEIRFEREKDKEKERVDVTFDATGKVVEEESDDEGDEGGAMDGGMAR